MTRVVILTASRRGLAALALPALVATSGIEVAAVIYSEGGTPSRWRSFRRILRKAWKIGLPGTINGVRVRKWFRDDVVRELGMPPLDEVAATLGVPFRTTPATNCETTRSLLRDARADLGISLGNSYIAPSVFGIPRRGFINIHHEVLPRYQGAQSVLWQIHDGSTTTGYSIHEIDRNIDTGAILYVETMPIEFRPTLRETVARSTAALYRASVDGLVRVLSDYDRYVAAATRQDGPRSHYTTPTLMQFLRMLANHRRLTTQVASR